MRRGNAEALPRRPEVEPVSFSPIYLPFYTFHKCMVGNARPPKRETLLNVLLHRDHPGYAAYAESLGIVGGSGPKVACRLRSPLEKPLSVL